jgi:DNA-binding protein Alba
MEQAKILKEKISIKHTETKSNIQENQIFVGNKPFMRYVRAVEMIVREKRIKNIVLKARGSNISRAVDLFEAVKNKFLKDLEMTSLIKTHTDDFELDGKNLSTSVIEITLVVK